MMPTSISRAAPSALDSRSRSYEKSERAFRTIGEVAIELDVAQHVLRFWESRFSQVRPVQRAGGRRYYRPEDVDLLRRIRGLLYEQGYTIKGVQRLLSGGRAAQLAMVEPAAASLPEPVEPVLPKPKGKLDAAQRQEVETLLADLTNALDLLRTTLRQQ